MSINEKHISNIKIRTNNGEFSITYNHHTYNYDEIFIVLDTDCSWTSSLKLKSKKRKISHYLKLRKSTIK